ncbi:MAG: group III truncated hemoglobin [Pseudomonadota bacterium]
MHDPANDVPDPAQAHMLLRFPITAEEIDQLVAAFYAEIRAHAVLGPVFMDAIGQDRLSWQFHEAKIASFWRNAVLMDRGYRGNPMMKHLANRDIRVEHFPMWLGLFRRVAFEVLPADRAANISALADRIGRGLSYGLSTARGGSAVPDLTR